MISANISNSTRKAVYRRDGYACALCNDPRHLQIHHFIKRSQGGSDGPQNLITLCQNCHALIHGTNLTGGDLTQEDAEQAALEYLCDYYLEHWNPRREGG